MTSDRVTFLYDGREMAAWPGERLLDAILSSDQDHRHVCGGRGFCTSCRVEVIAGEDALSPVSHLERERLGKEAGRLRLACQTAIYGHVEIRPPPPAPSRFSPVEE